MAYICDNCGKRIVYGRSQKHGRGVAGKRWKKRAQQTLRLFKPNLQRVTAVINGKRTKMRLCTDCIRKFKKEGKISKYSSVVTAA